MVVSSAPQLRSTYQLWHRFVVPVDGGQRDAISVPDYVADQLTSAYTIMVTSMVVNVWCICFALGFFYIMRHNRDLGQLSSNLWNKRASMADSLLSLISREAAHWRRWWVYPAIFIILSCWIAETVLSIVLPPLIFIDTAAPVNVGAIIVPPNTGTTSSDTAQLFSLDVPAALRAVGSALVAASDVAKRVTLTQRDMGTTPDFESIQEIDYSYHVTGHDLGLQHYSTLRLNVAGSCRTEYNWLVSSTNKSGYTNDTYAIFGDAAAHGHISLSLYDGPSPTAFFYTGGPGAGLGNITWAAFVSSVDRSSYTASTDAMYYTGTSTGTGTGTGTAADIGGTYYTVQPKRPVLSCWQSDVWSYKGANSSVVGLNSTMLPGLDLPNPLQLILARYLGTPRIESIGTQLGLGALQSSTSALGTIFDAGSASAFSDLQRLALAAYIASANTLTDTTLQSSYLGSKTQAGNLIYGDDNKPMAGAGDFVVWSSDVSTISVRAAIIIPVMATASWLLVLLVLKYTPLASVNTLDILELQKNIYQKYPDADLAMFDENTWHAKLHIPYIGSWSWGNGAKNRDGRGRGPSSDGTYQPPAQPTYADTEADVDADAGADPNQAQQTQSQTQSQTSSPRHSTASRAAVLYRPPAQPIYSTNVASALAHQEHEVAAAVAHEQAHGLSPTPSQESAPKHSHGSDLIELEKQAVHTAKEVKGE